MPDAAPVIAAAKELLSYQVDCLIATGATDPDRISTLCDSAGVKTINLDLPGRKAPSVISDNFTGARDLTLLILDRLGAPEAPLLFIGGRESDHNTSARIEGFLAAHAERSIDVPAANILACGYAAEKAEAALRAVEGQVARGLFVNSTITLEGVVRWLYGQSANDRATIRYGCFDWDPFAALLPANVGMARQDVATMLESTFDLLGSDMSPDETREVPCILTELGR